MYTWVYGSILYLCCNFEDEILFSIASDGALYAKLFHSKTDHSIYIKYSLSGGGTFYFKVIHPTCKWNIHFTKRTTWNTEQKYILKHKI